MQQVEFFRDQLELEESVGDGLLLVVAKNDRKVRIEVAKTLEGAVPDLAAKRIIEQAITPRFKQGDFAGGLDAGVDQLFRLIAGEALPLPSPTSEHNRSTAGFDWMDLAIFSFIAVPLIGSFIRRLLGPKLGSLVTGAAVGGLALFFTSSILIAIAVAIVALLYSLLSNPWRGYSGTRLGSGGSDWTSGSSGANSGGFGGGFTSGGGGDFGGVGASGDW